MTGAAEAMKIYLGQSVYKKVYLPKIFYRGRGNSENKRISNSTRIAKESLALMPTALSVSTTPFLGLEPENQVQNSDPTSKIFWPSCVSCCLDTFFLHANRIKKIFPFGSTQVFHQK